MVAYLLSGQVPDSSLSIVLLFSSWSTGAQEMNFQLLTLGWGGGVPIYLLPQIHPLQEDFTGGGRGSKEFKAGK